MLSVTAVAQLSSLVAAAAIMLVAGQHLPSGKYLECALAAGLCGAIGLLALYRALSIGVMSIAAPISALSALVPFAWGMTHGDSPRTLQLTGCAVALLGAVLAAREPSHAPVSRDRFRESILLAAGSAVLLGTGLIFLGVAAPAGPMPAIVADRIGSSGLVVPIALVTGRLSGLGIRVWLPMIAVGICDTGANALYVLAYNHGGMMALIGLLSSLYPITTVVLARFILSERLERHQAFGVCVALVGIAAVAAG